MVGKDVKKEIYVLLPDIRSVHNVASIFRTSDGAGVKKIFLSGYSPAPVDRFGRDRNDFSKVSLGAEKSVVWEVVEDIPAFIKKSKKEGMRVVAIEQDSRSISLQDFKEKVMEDKEFSKILFIFGNEVGGIEKGILELADEIVEIPMNGEKESLNVSVTAGIVLFCFR